MTTPICPADSSTTDRLFRPRPLRELVQGVPWLTVLEDTELEGLLAEAGRLKLSRHQWLFRQGMPAQWLYLVAGGAVRLACDSNDGRLTTVRYIGRYGVLDELSLASAQSEYLHSSETLCETRLLALPFDRCRSLVENDLACRAEFMKQLTTNVTEQMVDMALMAQDDTLSRLVSYLLRQLPEGPEEEPRTVLLTLPKCWLAKQLAMAPETLSRLLTRLRVMGAIDGYGQRLVVKDERMLRDLLVTEPSPS